MLIALTAGCAPSSAADAGDPAICPTSATIADRLASTPPAGPVDACLTYPDGVLIDGGDPPAQYVRLTLVPDSVPPKDWKLRLRLDFWRTVGQARIDDALAEAGPGERVDVRDKFARRNAAWQMGDPGVYCGPAEDCAALDERGVKLIAPRPAWTFSEVLVARPGEDARAATGSDNMPARADARAPDERLLARLRDRGYAFQADIRATDARTTAAGAAKRLTFLAGLNRTLEDLFAR